VLDPHTEDFKTSAQEFLDRAAAVILHDGPRIAGARWQRVSLKPVTERPIFRITPPLYVTPAMVEFVRDRISKAASERVRTVH